MIASNAEHMSIKTAPRNVLSSFGQFKRVQNGWEIWTQVQSLPRMEAVKVMVSLRNSLEEQMEPSDVSVSIFNSTARIMSAPCISDSEDSFGIVRGAQPFVRVRPAIISAHVYQRNPLAGASNQIVLADVRFSSGVTKDSILSLSGFEELVTAEPCRQPHPDNAYGSDNCLVLQLLATANSEHFASEAFLSRKGHIIVRVAHHIPYDNFSHVIRIRIKNSNFARPPRVGASFQLHLMMAGDRSVHLSRASQWLLDTIPERVTTLGVPGGGLPLMITVPDMKLGLAQQSFPFALASNTLSVEMHSNVSIAVGSFFKISRLKGVADVLGVSSLPAGMFRSARMLSEESAGFYVSRTISANELVLIQLHVRNGAAQRLDAHSLAMHAELKSDCGPDDAFISAMTAPPSEKMLFGITRGINALVIVLVGYEYASIYQTNPLANAPNTMNFAVRLNSSLSAGSLVKFTGFQALVQQYNLSEASCLKPAVTDPTPATAAPLAAECPPGFTGLECESCQNGMFAPSCQGPCTMLGSCSGNGRCGPRGECICYDGWTGDRCDVRQCEEQFGSVACETCEENAFSTTCDAGCSLLGSCSGNGRCLPSGECECYEGFTGASCDRRECGSGYGSPSCETCEESTFSGACDAGCSLLGSCSGNGRCLPSGECECYSGFASATCETCAEGTFSEACDLGCSLLGEAGRGCSGHGRCLGDSTCLCYEGFTGASCDVRIECQNAGYSGIGCTACRKDAFASTCTERCSLIKGCHGHGRCDGDGACICYEVSP